MLCLMSSTNDVNVKFHDSKNCCQNFIFRKNWPISSSCLDVFHFWANNALYTRLSYI